MVYVFYTVFLQYSELDKIHLECVLKGSHTVPINIVQGSSAHMNPAQWQLRVTPTTQVSLFTSTGHSPGPRQRSPCLAAAGAHGSEAGPRALPHPDEGRDGAACPAATDPLYLAESNGEHSAKSSGHWMVP